MPMSRLPLLLLTLCLAAHAETTWYVSPDGNDAAAGTMAAPFATPARAQLAVREAAKAGQAGPFVVELRAGTYPLAEKLAFTHDDPPATWRAHGDERPVVSGGQVIGGWQESSVDGRRRWTVTLPEVKAGSWYFRQLFLSQRGGPYQRRYRPHLGMLAVDKLTYSPRRPGMSHRAAQIDFHFYPGDIQNWQNLDDVEVVALHMWSSSRLRIANVDERKRIVTFTGMPTFAIGQVGPHNPYFVENVKEALDEPGEWYLDRPTGVLTYLPLDGEQLADCQLVAPRLTRVMAIQGDVAAGRFVKGLRFEGLTFSHNESPLPKEGYGGSQAQPDLPAAIEAVGADDCVFSRCTISQTGNYGLGIGQGCHNNRVEGCRLFDLGGGGIKIGDIAMSNKAEAPVLPTGNVVENCALSDGGLMYYSANAIWAGIVRDTVIRHNEIWNFPYSGIAVGWSWSDQPTSCGNNEISYNRIHHVVQLLADGASIYTLGRQPGTVIRGNVLHDNVRGPHARQYWQLGLYLDEGSSEMLVEDNLAYRCGTHGFNMNGGAENLIRNNIFGPVYGNSGPFVRSHKKPYARANVYTQNLNYCDSPNLADAAWAPELLDCKANLYYNFAGQPLMFAGKSFAEWQASGQDAGSVDADPLFVDPERGDYRLKPGSPALALGFKPFDAGLAGLIKEYQDVAVPVQVTTPPVYVMPQREIPPDPLGFDIDCEDVPVGVCPREFSPRTDDGKQADVGVTETVAQSGSRSLMMIDHQGTAKSFYPYLTHRLIRPVTAGKVTLSYAIRQDPAKPGAVSFEFRDYQPPGPKREFVGGPAVFLDPDGTVRSGNETLGKLTPGVWAEVAVEFTVGNPEARSATVRLTLPNATPKQVSVPINGDFQTVSQLLVVGFADVDGSVFLDDLVLKVE